VLPAGVIGLLRGTEQHKELLDFMPGTPIRT